MLAKKECLVVSQYPVLGNSFFGWHNYVIHLGYIFETIICRFTPSPGDIMPGKYSRTPMLCSLEFFGTPLIVETLRSQIQPIIQIRNTGD